MHPLLYKCGFFNIYTYGFFVAIAFLVATTLLTQEARRRHLDENRMYDLCLVVLVSGIVFARLSYVALNWNYFRQDLLEIVMLQHGGLIWFGGLIGACLGGFGFIRLKKLNLLAAFDLFTPYVALGQAIGRIGCFYNGCCYGRESAAWGMYFPAQGRLLFPSQILDSLTLLIIFAILRSVSAKKQGMIFAFYLMLAGAQRFLLEFVRGDVRPFYFSLSIFQWMSIAVFGVGLFFYWALSWKKKTI
jgi:phosphatidylglycerol:prolipoprotein diacylglycerol transferase